MHENEAGHRGHRAAAPVRRDGNVAVRARTLHETPLLKRTGHRTVRQSACSRGVTHATHRKQLSSRRGKHESYELLMSRRAAAGRVKTA